MQLTDEIVANFEKARVFKVRSIDQLADLYTGHRSTGFAKLEGRGSPRPAVLIRQPYFFPSRKHRGCRTTTTDT